MNTILLVDDDDYVINGLLKHIPWEEMNVRIVGTAADGREGLEQFRRLKPDFVITDIYMPLMDGFELIEAIHADDPEVPVVILSGYDDLANARKAVSSGVHHFLLKPPSIAEIEFVVREVLQLLNESRERDELLGSYLQQQDVVRRSMKEVFFRDLLATRYQEEELPRERIAFMDLPVTTSVQALTISLIRSDSGVRRDEREWQLLRFGTGNIIRESLAEGLRDRWDLRAETLSYWDQEFVVVFLGADGNDAEQQAFIAELSNGMLRHILQYMKLPSLAGLGTVAPGYHGLIDSYLESRSALEVAEMNEWNRVYAYAPGEECDGGGGLSMETLRRLHDALLRKEWRQAGELWARLSRELSASGVSLPACKSICAGIASSLWLASLASAEASDGTASQTAAAFPGAARAASAGEAEVGVSRPDAAGTADDGSGLEVLLLQLNRCGSIRQMLEWMNETLLRSSIRFGEEQTGKRSNALVDSVIRDFVERCYHEDLSLERIAARLHVNRTYLSQLFKRVTGEAFVTYVNKYRIRKAIELLRTGKYMVYEVSERVGFQNATYFSQVFKSIAGCTPSEYDKRFP